MSDYFWVIQACGAAALLIQSVSNFLPCGKKILKIQAVSQLLWGAYYWLSDLSAVMMTSLAGALRNIVSSHASPRILVRYNILNTVILCAVLCLSVASVLDLLPVLATILFYFRMVSRDHLFQFHAYGLVCAGIWTIYEIYCQAWFGVASDTISILCCLAALYRVYLKQKPAVPPPLPA